MDRDDEANFARRMVEIRERLGISQSELARRMVERGFDTYSQMTVSRTEKGERPIRLGEARVLSELLEMSLEGMMRGTSQDEFLAEVEKVQAAITQSMFGVALSLWDYGEATSDIDLLSVSLSLFRDDEESDEARSALAVLSQLRFPIEVVAKWAAEVASTPGRDVSVPELTFGDVDRLRELEKIHGEHQTED